MERKLDYVHVGREIRASQLREILEDPTIIEKLKHDLRMAHIPFARIDNLRITLAKHEVKVKNKSIAYAPGLTDGAVRLNMKSRTVMVP